MAQYNFSNVNLSTSQLNKLKPGIKMVLKQLEVTNVVDCDGENSFPHK